MAGIVIVSMALGMAACGGGGAPAPDAAPLSDQAALGERLFNDRSLSASGNQSCASCHAAERGHAPDNTLSSQFGGAHLDQAGLRNAPGIRYLSANTAFTLAADGTPSGGFFWDGRAATLQDQAGQPFLNPREMANGDVAEVVARLAKASYVEDFKRVFGADILADPEQAFQRMTLALQQYQLEDADFRPFSSKYDAFLSGQATLSDTELRGLAWFNSPAKGNCAACHPSARGADVSFPLFTDFSYDALGVPRNPALPANADPTYFDLGLCGRADLAARQDLCGAFKVPSLRNVALRGALFHNGRFGSLKEALSFYVQRDTKPEKWYPLNPDGSVNKFDDLPVPYRTNVNTSEAPYNRKPGDAPALSDAEIDDVIAFLNTLSDGYAP